MKSGEPVSPLPEPAPASLIGIADEIPIWTLSLMRSHLRSIIRGYRRSREGPLRCT